MSSRLRPHSPAPAAAALPDAARRTLLLALAAAATRAGAAQEADVAVKLDEGRVVIDVSVQVPFSRAIAWAVMTDYAHMTKFFRTLKTSNVLSRDGNVLTVEQSGEVKVLFMNFAFSSVRTIELVPEREIRARLVRGDFKTYDSTTRLSGDAAGPTTLVQHGEYVPSSWVPPGLGPSMIASETRKQYDDLIGEMQRRATAQK